MEFKRDYCGLIVFLLIDIAFAIWWIRMRLGLDKRWFVMPARAVVSSGFYFALPAIILGFVTAIWGLLLVILDPRGDDIPFPFYITFGLLGLGYVFAYFEPNWLSPEWYRWLKKEHGDILEDLAEEAHWLGREEWLKQVETQKDLERWVEDFRRRHGL
jgi:hypothetical protein